MGYLFESEKYLEVLEKTARLESRGKDDPPLEEVDLEDIYYRSYSLKAVGKLEEGLELH